MNKKVFIQGFILFCCIVGFVIFSAGFDMQAKADVRGALKVGVVDVSKVLEGYGKKADFSKQLEDLRSDKQKDIEQKRIEGQTLKDKIELLLPGSPERKKQEEALSKLDIEINVMGEAALKNMSEMHAKMLVQLYQEITEECVAHAKAEGFDLILKKEEIDLERLLPREIQFTINMQKIIYNSPEIDITPAIIKRMQEKYESTRGVDREDES